jgi:hypothetical protein
MTTVEVAAPGRHRRRTSCPDWLAWLLARLLDAGAVMLTGLIAAVVIVVAASAVLAVLIYLAGGR